MLTAQELAALAKRCCQDAVELPSRPRALLQDLCNDPRIHHGRHRDAVRLIRRALEVDMNIPANRKGGLPKALGLSSDANTFLRTKLLAVVRMMEILLEHTEWKDPADKKVRETLQRHGGWDYIRDSSGAIGLSPISAGFSDQDRATLESKRRAGFQLLRCWRKRPGFSKSDLAAWETDAAVILAAPLTKEDWTALEKEAGLLNAANPPDEPVVLQNARIAIVELVQRWRKRAAIDKKGRAALLKAHEELAGFVVFPYRSKQKAAEAVARGFRAAKIPTCASLTADNVRRIFSRHRDLKHNPTR